MSELKYYNEEDKDVIAKVIEIAEENGFSVDVYNNREDKEEYYFEFVDILPRLKNVGFLAQT